MESEQLWIPNLVFGNSVKDTAIQNDEFSALLVKQQHEPYTFLNSDLTENDIYVGSLNPLIFERIYERKLRCEFELHFFPFDIQKCHIQVIFLFVAFKCSAMLIFWYFYENDWFYIESNMCTTTP